MKVVLVVKLLKMPHSSFSSTLSQGHDRFDLAIALDHNEADSTKVVNFFYKYEIWRADREQETVSTKHR